ncbi:MAG: ADP-glyceromanno-heptose 6-epimerase [Gammaproteobacteria bacterium]|nr:ADP-glyceromanno-heptose 6-epimerase [Gammaproteobacteria bacterium]
MIIVTGGAGFIGSNLLRYLNSVSQEPILVVDDLTDGSKFRNLVGVQIADYMDKDEFLGRVQTGQDFGSVSYVLHQGACSDTTEWNGRLMMADNYHYSRAVLDFCQAHEVPLIYASSAAVYGASEQFSEHPRNEQPLNVYGYSKLLFDQYVRRMQATARAQIVGLRYFNVYGPNEKHKKSMASVAFHFDQQIRQSGVCRLFAGHDGYAAGEQQRDFVYVGDVCKVVSWFMEHADKSGIFNVGTGRSQSFNDVANAVIRWHGAGDIEYIPFPEHLEGRYQSFTQADLTDLRHAGYRDEFADVATGVTAYLDAENP